MRTKFYIFQRRVRNFLFRVIDKVYKNFINCLSPKYTISNCFSSEDALYRFADKKNYSLELRNREHILNKYKQNKNIRNDYLSGNKSIKERHEYFSSLIAFYKDNVSILDFGGGFQSIHFPIIASNPSKIINTHVYEPFHDVVKLNKKIHANKDDIKYSDIIPEDKYDFIYFGSSIQYELCKETFISAAKKAQYAVISYSPMILEGKSFYTITVPSNKSFVPIKIWNVNELINFFEQNGFVLLNQVIKYEDKWNYGVEKYKNFIPNLLLKNSNFN
jgi:putative methyltransferase (TIGR04325 family)